MDGWTYKRNPEAHVSPYFASNLFEATSHRINNISFVLNGISRMAALLTIFSVSNLTATCME
jgi:hypothetical protein